MADNPTYDALHKQVQELEQALAEHEKSNREFDHLFFMALDLICIADIHTTAFIKVNPACREILKFSQEELIGQPFFDFIHPDDIAPTRQVVEKKLQQGEKIINFENRYICKDGTYKWLSWVSHPSPEKGVTYAIAHQGVLDEGVQFIQKPFSMKDIAVKIQNILEGADDNDFKNHTELIKEK